MKPKKPEPLKPIVDPSMIKTYVSPDKSTMGYNTLINTSPTGLAVKANTAKKTLTGG